ncbi:hypothetical protein [Lichenibacterium dinghuense]|uniref:hypothetical protein n=1 Tax=Lichenibacterium dinghuense TaxID=2895977 RepID=UPI001F3B9C89|nr:hypothetical protein [Lichenibacterium sp. 6Y81]
MKTLSAAALAAAALLCAASAARADCESDMLQLEDAMKTPDQTPAVKAAYDDAAKKSASAMRKDDDDTCHKVIGDALAKAGKTLR